jgi:hypothetical protein
MVEALKVAILVELMLNYTTDMGIWKFENLAMIYDFLGVPLRVRLFAAILPWRNGFKKFITTRNGKDFHCHPSRVTVSQKSNHYKHRILSSPFYYTKKLS